VKHVCYPGYFSVILGVWKVLGAVAVLAPRFPRLKEWAYAGMFFNMMGAVVSHLAVGDPAVTLVAPIIFICLVAASWVLRPSARRVLLSWREGDACEMRSKPQPRIDLSHGRDDPYAYPESREPQGQHQARRTYADYQDLSIGSRRYMHRFRSRVTNGAIVSCICKVGASIDLHTQPQFTWAIAAMAAPSPTIAGVRSFFFIWLRTIASE
jgi:hypothetical protein